MSRRWRIRLVWLSILLGLPLALAGVVVSLAWSGRLESVIAAQYATAFPGNLSLGSIRITGADEVVVRDVVLRDGWHRPLMTVDEVVVRMDMVRLEPTAITAIGVKGFLDERNFIFLKAITDAAARMPPSDPPVRFHLDAAGEVDLPQGLTIRNARATGVVTGPLFEIAGTAVYDGRPIVVDTWSRTIRGAEQARRIGVELKDVAGDGQKALRACADLGLLPATPEAVMALVPGMIDASGSLVTRDVGVFRFGADMDLRWEDRPARGGGRLRARLDADQHRVQLTQVRLDDRDLGRIGHTAQGPGTAEIDLVAGRFSVTAPAITPGPRLPLPAGLPLEGLATHAPRLALGMALDGSGGEVVLAGLDASRTRAGATWITGTSVRIDATELPLALCQQLMPPGVALAGGIAARMTLDLDLRGGLSAPVLTEGRATVRQARGGWGGWSAGPLDADILAKPADDGLLLAMTLPQGTITARGGTAGATATVDVMQVETLLALIHGPMALPDVRGRLSVQATWAQQAETREVRIDRLSLNGVGLPDRLRDLAGTVTGRLRWTATSPLAIDLGGQLTAGDLLLPGGWLPLAAKQPLFTLGLDLVPAEGPQPGRMDLRQLLVRAATADGKPQEGGYSAEFRGRLDLDGTGTAEGLVDHADLDWLNRHASKGGALATGQGAITCTAQLDAGGVRQVEGHFLPLDVDLTIGHRFKASGITGAVAFTLTRPPTE